MSITRFTFTLVALTTTLALVPAAQAQLLKPFAFPPIESDFQFFAPADIDTYGGGPEHKTGWFATFDRVYMSAQRPEFSTYQTQSPIHGDFTWGNRFDLGYMDDDGKGWTFTGWHIDGPNENDILVTERLNRYITDAAPAAAAVQPYRDNNLRLTGDRDYLVTNSINVADLSGIELNRTWMLEPLHNGAILEPMVGFRYVRIIDFYRRDNYSRYDENGTIVNPLPGVTTLTATTEQLNSLNAEFMNDMVGGQLGIHWSKEYRRWNFSGDVKGFAFQNFQKFSRRTIIETTEYAGNPDLSDSAPATVQYEENGASDHDAEFVFGMEVRAEAAFRVTRDISLRAGFEFMDFGQGIGRGNDPLANDQDMILYGLTFGATLNR
jgi:hypothetical protein